MAISDYVSRKELAARGPIPYSTLKKLALRDDGPPMVRIGGRVYYHLPTVEAWLKGQLTSPIPTKPRRGRPTKAEQIARENAKQAADEDRGTIR